MISNVSPDGDVSSNPSSLWLLKQGWNAYNAEDSFLPLYLPLVIWIGAYLVSGTVAGIYPVKFDKWAALHNLHNVGAFTLGIVSLYFGDDTTFGERIPILWSIGYFVVDLWDCLLRGDVAYTTHATICLALGYGNYSSPQCRALRMNSKATLCELSNPFLAVSRKTRKPLHFAVFALVFTCCRILWIPCLVYQLRVVAGMEWTNPRLLGVCGFYCLNLYWYFKILRVLFVEGAHGKTAKKES